MTRAVLLVSLIAAVVSEAPYSLPRPGPQQQQFSYPSAPAPRPPSHHHHHHNFAQQQTSSGYHYQQPSIAPAFVQPAAPQQQYIQAPQAQYIPAPQPQYLPSQPVYQQPRPQPYYPAPQPQYQPQPIQQLPPSASYGVPQYPSQPQPAPLPAYIPQPQPVQVYQPQYEQQVQVFQPQQIQQPQQGYFYAQPLPQSFLRQQLSQQPLQSQSIGGSSLSSYQADTNQYNTAQGQTHRDALDAATVDRVQNIIRENEHSTARHAGYLSLVSGVSLESAKPSIELGSFTQNSPLTQSSALSTSSVSQGYNLPSTNTQSSQSNSLSNNFLPQTQPANSYGTPK